MPARPPSDDERRVALLALANLVRLMGAELVAGAHRDNVDRVELAIRAKLRAIDTSSFTPGAAERGFAEAEALIEQALVNVREQAAAAQTPPPADACAVTGSARLH
ncbi:hypothetical protein [Methylobacterium nigriterrae]|uniref:hypothetical protein n=1 Tax=Methylobacterium nigriterrae TaxID=3127512 RepID=UPI003013F662